MAAHTHTIYIYRLQLMGFYIEILTCGPDGSRHQHDQEYEGGHPGTGQYRGVWGAQEEEEQKSRLNSSAPADVMIW